MTAHQRYSGDDPKTVGQLYDLLQSWFGFGDWDETTDGPWYEARMVEIGKLKRLIQGRLSSIRQVHITAKYCRDQGIAVRSPAGLFFHMGDALKADREDKARAKSLEIERDFIAAIEYERTHHPNDEKWLGRLLRAHGETDKKEVLHRWKLGRQQYRKNARATSSATKPSRTRSS